MLGISSYFQDLDYEYLKRASEIGARYLFTSLHIPEEDLSHLPQTLPIFLEKCKAYNLDLVPDVSPVTFEKLGIAPNDYAALKALGFKVLRLDYGFDDFEVVKELLESFDLMLNASVVNEQYILDAKAAGVDFTRISMLHNFYPKQETGLSIDYFKSMNVVFEKHGLRISAFVPGDKIKRFPMYEGLPTVERHRSMNPYVSAVQLIQECGMSDIFIGDSIAKESTLIAIQEFMETKVMTIPVIMEKGFEHILDTNHVVRKDLSESIIRLIVPRTPEIQVYNNIKRPRGAITLDNMLSGRYSGELQICKKDMGMHSSVNVIGYIHPEYVELVDYIDRSTTVKFVSI